MSKFSSTSSHQSEWPAYGAFRDMGRFLVFVARRFVREEMGLAASALTYSTLLSLVPSLVIAFAILSEFPAFDIVKARMEDLALGALVPEVGADAKTYLTEFTGNASNLTAVGIVGLALVAVLLLSTIESTLNRIWQVERARPMAMRLLTFWAILSVGPMLLGAGFVLSSDLFATIQIWLRLSPGGPTTGFLPDMAKILVAILTQSATITLLFYLVPARSVRLRDAALGGLFSGVGLQVLRYGFDLFVTTSSTYATIYGAVAIVPIFLLWLYSIWTIILLGAILAASIPDWWARRGEPAANDLSPSDRLEMAVAVLQVLSRQAEMGGSISREKIDLAVPQFAGADLIAPLQQAGYIVITQDRRLSLSRDLNRTTVADLAQDLGLLLGRHAGAEDQSEDGLGKSGNDTLTARLIALGRAEEEILGQTVAGAVKEN